MEPGLVRCFGVLSCIHL